MQEDASDTESCIVPEIKMTRESLALYQLCADEDLNRIMMIMIRRSRKLREIILYSAYIYDMSNYIHQMKTSTDIKDLIASVNRRMIAYTR